jgi:hypothetical protein
MQNPPPPRTSSRQRSTEVNVQLVAPSWFTAQNIWALAASVSRPPNTITHDNIRAARMQFPQTK